MTTQREALRRRVSDALGNRELIWAGLRGDDSESLSDLPQYSASYTIINEYKRRPLRHSLAYEDLSGVRVDMETWDIDDHLAAPETVEFRRELLKAMSTWSALVPYRPSRFLSALWFARRDRCLNLGLFGSHQFAFEHKPWVECAVAGLGIPNLGWRYVADEEQLDAERLLADGPIMVRRSRTSGGEGLVRVNAPEGLAAAWPRHAEAFASIAPFVADGVPVNVGATVWVDGVTVHFPSIQLIGIPSCVTREFGYCGNDFARARDLPRDVIDEIESSTVRIGGWLRDNGYLGTFGVDYLVHDGHALFTEVNPRFQGSTRASARLSIDRDEPCLPLEHIAATLRFPCPERPALRDLVSEAPALAQVVIHNTAAQAHVDVGPLRKRLRDADTTCRMDASVRKEILTERGGVVARATFSSSVTDDGHTLRRDLASAIEWFAEAHLESEPDERTA